MFHSHAFDTELSQELAPALLESAAPKWFPILVGTVGIFYGGLGALLFAYLG
jgi:hypothetical protein